MKTCLLSRIIMIAYSGSNQYLLKTNEKEYT